MLDTLAMSATGLIEQEGPLVGALSRVCAGLRGEGYEWRWEGDEEVMRKREEEREVERKEEEEVERKREAARRAREERREEERVRREEEEEKLRREEEEKEKEEEAMRIKEEQEAAAVAAAAALAEAAAAEAAAAEAATLEAAATIAADSASAPATEANAIAVANTLPLADTDDPMHSIAPPLDADSTAMDTSLDLPLPALPFDALPALPFDALPALPTDDLPALPTDELPHDAEADDDSSREEPTRRRSGRVASRTDNPRHRSSSASSSSSHTPVRLESTASRAAEEEMPEYAKRLVDPEVYVRSLFVSRESVEMPLSSQGGPAGSTASDLLSPNEQEVMVHDCLTCVPFLSLSRVARLMRCAGTCIAFWRIRWSTERGWRRLGMEYWGLRGGGRACGRSCESSRRTGWTRRRRRRRMSSRCAVGDNCIAVWVL